MVSLLLHNRDLRVHDHPALRAASRGADGLVPLFVLDDRLLRGPTMGANRVCYLLEALESLRSSYESLGTTLVVRRGDPAAVAVSLAIEVAANAVHASRDWTEVARRREARLAEACHNSGIELVFHPGTGIVDAGSVVPGAGGTGAGDHYKVFTPFLRAWSARERRLVIGRPRRLPRVPDGLETGRIPTFEDLRAGGRRADPLGRSAMAPVDLGRPSPGRLLGGEARALERVAAFEVAGQPARYDEVHDDLAAAATSRVSADLHFGCLSPRQLEQWALDRPGGEAFVRQLAWRDFYLSVTAAFPAIAREDYRPRGRLWREDERELDAWKRGETGQQLVDAAMRQLLEEGFVHNRARLVASSYLTKTLGHHWSEGAAHYMRWLTDADVANNAGNWQWMAGTGNDTRPNRRLNPERQAARYDPAGEYRERWLRSGTPG